MNLRDFMQLDLSEIRQIVRDYYDETPEYRLQTSFEEYVELYERCPVCNELMKVEFIDFYHKWDKGELEDKICEQCFDDEE